MIRTIVAALALIGAVALPAADARAASEGYTTADVNLRAGPSTEYPRILVLPYGSPVTVYGCVRGYTWCDVSYYHERGWVSSRYLDIFYDDRRVYVPYRPRVEVPIITFDFGYWDTWYPRYPWYRDYRWRREYPDSDWYVERRRENRFYPPEEGERRLFLPDSEVQIIRPQREESRREQRREEIRREQRREEIRREQRREEIRREQRWQDEPTLGAPTAENMKRFQKEKRREIQAERKREKADRKKREEAFRPGVRAERADRNDRRRGVESGNTGECVMRNGRCVVVQE